MRYWNVQRIVREYVCEVRMVADPGRDVGPGHIQSPEHGYRELKEVCEIIAEICAAREKVPQERIERFVS